MNILESPGQTSNPRCVQLNKHDCLLTLTSVCIFSVLFLYIYISQDADNENLFNDEDRAYLWLVIISFILVTLMCNSEVIL